MGTGAILNGAREAVPGVDLTNYLDDPVLRLRKGEDFKGRPPGTWIRAVVLHTTKGIMGTSGVLPGLGPSVDAGERCARYWSSDARNAGAHLVVDHDGLAFQTADLVTEMAYGCPKWNLGAVHIELYQGPNGELYEGQLAVCVALVDWLTGRLGIQRQMPERYVGASARLAAGDESATGVFGHRDLAYNRGAGDPGSAIFNRLGGAGYELMNFDLSEDRGIWRRRQRDLGITADGIAGPGTLKAIAAASAIPGLKGPRPRGLWIERPVDSQLGA